MEEEAYRRGGVPRYIEKPNKSAVENDMTNPPIQTLNTFGPITWFNVGNEIESLPLSKVIELQKQPLYAPVVWKKQTNRIPVAETIAMDFPNHRQTIAPAFW